MAVNTALSSLTSPSRIRATTVRTPEVVYIDRGAERGMLQQFPVPDMRMREEGNARKDGRGREDDWEDEFVTVFNVTEC